MQSLRSSRIVWCIGIALLPFLQGVAQDVGPDRATVQNAMRRATDFMFDSLANQGGFVWVYVDDNVPYGELKARPSMIWVEPPSTPSVGILLLEAYQATGDTMYLDRAGDVAQALEAGQHPSGGWHYFIDFDPDGLQEYYDTFFSKCWGWQEYLKKRDNCTFDDYSTTEATRFFLRLYAVSHDEEVKRVLDKALGHILRAQYSNGGWPQRYPLERDVHDYTRACTLNDDVTLDCIRLLLEAAKTLQDRRFQAAAERGMDFYIAAQQPAPQAGWAQQCSQNFTPVWGRPFEIGTVSSTETTSSIQALTYFYQVTGRRKYLAPIPKALDWLEASVIPDAGDHTHTCFYEMGTNRPVYILQTGTTIDDVQYTPTYDREGVYPYAHKLTINVEGLRKDYARLAATTPTQAMRDYAVAQQNLPLPKQVIGGYLAGPLARTQHTPEGIQVILDSQESTGGWKDPVSIMNPFSPFTQPRRDTDGYVTGGYIARMYRMINYLNGME